MKPSLFALTFLVFALNLAAQPSRVLVIYNSSAPYNTESLDVAQYYQNRRGIPVANRCGIPFPGNVVVTEAQWLSSVRNAVRGCLDTVGRTNVLYIVMSYQTPYILFRASPAQNSSLDSYISDVWDAYSITYFPSVPAGAHRYFMNAQTSGNVYDSFQTFETHRAGTRAALIYPTWRLDAASAAVAKGLVDQAVDTELAGGLTPGGVPVGTVYVDGRYPSLAASGDLSYESGEFDLDRVARMTALAGLPVVHDKSPDEIGVGSAVPSAPNAMLYSGWYAVNDYHDVFTWKRGAIGWHLDSGALENPRAGASWSARAIAAGIAVTSGAVSEPFLEGMAHPDVVVRHLYQGGTVGDAFFRGTAWLKWKIVQVGDPLYRPFPGGVPPFNNPAFREASLRVSTTALVSGTVQVQLTLQDPAPSGGQTVTWYNSYSPYYVSALPASTVIPAGQRVGTVSLTVTSPVPDTYRGVTVYATAGATSLQNTTAVYTLLGGIPLAASSVKAGNTLGAAVVVNQVASFSGTTVNLTSSNPAILQVPPSVVVPWGAQVKAFNITTTPGSVATNTSVTITAVSGVSQITNTVIVTP